MKLSLRNDFQEISEKWFPTQLNSIAKNCRIVVFQETGYWIHVGMDEMYEIVHQDTYWFFGIDEMYKLVMDEM